MRHVYAIFAVTFLLATANSSASEQTINGKIKAVDAGKNSITVDDVVLDVSRKTKITVDGKKATLADIKPGQQALVTYDNSIEAAITIARQARLPVMPCRFRGTTSRCFWSH